MRSKILRAGLAVLAAGFGLAQTADQAKKLEVASVKPRAPGGMGGGPRLGGPGGLLGRPDPGLIRYPSISLKQVLAACYGIQAYQISGPGWMDSELYDIVASVPQGATKDQVKLMLQGLLVERFRLVLSRRTKELPIYALVIGKNGSKLKESVDEPNLPNLSYPGSPPNYPIGKDGFPQPPRGNSGGINIMMAGPGRVRFSSVLQPLPEFARFLGVQLGRPVVDRTGLTGRYDFNVDFTPAEDQVPKGPSGEDMQLRRPPPGEEGPDLFAAIQEQLGLRLESKREPVELLVIERAERVPIENL